MQDTDYASNTNKNGLLQVSKGHPRNTLYKPYLKQPQGSDVSAIYINLHSRMINQQPLDMYAPICSNPYLQYGDYSKLFVWLIIKNTTWRPSCSLN